MYKCPFCSNVVETSHQMCSDCCSEFVCDCCKKDTENLFLQEMHGIIYCRSCEETNKCKRCTYVHTSKFNSKHCGVPCY